MKIRIGNDIRLDVQLIYNNINEQVNINSVKAFIINDTKRKEIEDELIKKPKFINRFPIEPFVDTYSSNAYDVKSSGRPTWNVFPCDCSQYIYPGFGVYPDWDHVYGFDRFKDITKYRAKVKYTEERDTIQVFFPAEAQLFTGKYSLVIVAKIYEPGYSDDNLRTVSIDYDDVFELVDKSQEGIDGPVTIIVSDGSYTKDTAEQQQE